MADDDWNNIRIMSMITLSVVCVLGVLGNGVVIWATGFRMKKTTSTVWYLNLAVADFLVTAFLPLKITYYALDYHWPFGNFLCKMDSTIFYVNLFSSVLTLAVISVDRCLCVVRPVWTQNHRTVRNASWVSLGVWVMALAPSIPNSVFKSTVPCSDGKEWCTYNYLLSAYENVSREQEDDPLYRLRFQTTVFTNFLVGFLFPFSVIVSCYSVVIYRLRNNRSLARQSCHTYKIIAAVIGTFFLCWAPYHILRLIDMQILTGLMKYDPEQDRVINFGSRITLTLALLNSCLNPLLYVLSQGCKDVFRRSILKVLEKVFAEDQQHTNNTDLRMMTRSEISGSNGPSASQEAIP